MGKNKLARFADNERFEHVVQPDFEEVFKQDYTLKGRWKTDFFKSNHPLILELGCGKGEYTVGLARQYHNNNFLGIDIKGARIWRGAKTAYEENLPNVGFLRTRIDFVNSFFDQDEVDEIWITFPDPQPKKPLKRLTSSKFLQFYKQFLKPGGFVHLKTDNDDLYRYTQEVIALNQFHLISNIEDIYELEEKPDVFSIQTFYEKMFRETNKSIHYLKFQLDRDLPFHEPKKE